MGNGIPKKLALSFGLSLGLVTSVAAGPLHVPLDDGFTGHKIRWSGRSTGDTTIIYKVINVNGKAAVCGGFFTEGNGSIVSLSRASLRASSVEVAGVTLSRSASFFTRIDLDAAVESIEVRCQVSRQAWQSGFASAEPQLVSTQSRFEY